MNNQKPVIRPILPDEKICYNCKYMLWLVAVGAGVRCNHTQNRTSEGKDFMIPNRFHTCAHFEYKKEAIE